MLSGGSVAMFDETIDAEQDGDAFVLFHLADLLACMLHTIAVQDTFRHAKVSGASWTDRGATSAILAVLLVVVRHPVGVIAVIDARL